MRALKSKLHPSHDSTLTRRDVIKEMGRGVAGATVTGMPEGK